MATWKKITGVFIFLLFALINTASARFLGMDPAPVNPEDPRTFNRYSYANNNPYRFVDPNGKDAVVASGNIKIVPVTAGVPSVTISNTAGAKGFSSSEFLFHKYKIIILHHILI